MLLLPARLKTLSVRKQNFPNEGVIGGIYSFVPSALNFITQGGLSSPTICW
ncbi:hypothetical protein St703_04820 [Sporolactobacillus terrae]|uniref:Uncharacterized protein n=1 Tax=Sporolactobacillus terrae TaxID=269673 RepID=A0A5K7WTV0_9BACL|nr:hypothetical protein St703_04820 [Sporolactobacillus terrae]